MQTKRYAAVVISLALLLALGVYLNQTGTDLQDGHLYQLALFGAQESSLGQVHRLRVDLHFLDGDLVQYRFHDRDQEEDRISVTRRLDGKTTRITGEAAQKEIEALVRKLPHPENIKEAMALIEKALAHLQVDQRELREFHLQMELGDGREYDFELETQENRNR